MAKYSFVDVQGKISFLATQTQPKETFHKKQNYKNPSLMLAVCIQNPGWLLDYIWLRLPV